MIKVILISLLSTITIHSANAIVLPQNYETLLSKEWKMRYVDEGGKREYPDVGEENDRIILNINHTGEIREAGESQEGLWQYDPAAKRLVFTNRVTKEKFTMMVVKLTSDELVVKMIEEGMEVSTVYMVPVKK